MGTPARSLVMRDMNLSFSSYWSLMASRVWMSSSLLPVLRSIFYVILIQTALMLSLMTDMLSTMNFSNSSYLPRMDFFCSLMESLISWALMFMGVSCSRYLRELLITSLRGRILWSLWSSLQQMPQMTLFSMHLGSMQTRLRASPVWQSPFLHSGYLKAWLSALMGILQLLQNIKLCMFEKEYPAHSPSQGWFITQNMLSLIAGSLFSIPDSKSLNNSQISGGNSSLLVCIFLKIQDSWRPVKGARPTLRLQSTTPSDQISAFLGDLHSPEMTSGAMQEVVPQNCLSLLAEDSLVSMQSPKSMNLTVRRSQLATMLSSLMSLWAYDSECRYIRPEATDLKTCLSYWLVSFLLRATSLRLLGRYSSMMYRLLFSRKLLQQLIKLGWLSSLMKSCSVLLGSMIFTATHLSQRMSLALQTCPESPLPIARSSWYLPRSSLLLVLLLQLSLLTEGLLVQLALFPGFRVWQVLLKNFLQSLPRAVSWVLFRFSQGIVWHKSSA